MGGMDCRTKAGDLQVHCGMEMTAVSQQRMTRTKVQGQLTGRQSDQ